MPGENDLSIVARKEDVPVANVTTPDAGKEAISSNLAARPAQPVDESATWEQLKALGSYMTRTEVHTYAFSVAAQVILSLFPFIVLLLTLTENVFHSPMMSKVVAEMISNFL